MGKNRNRQSQGNNMSVNDQQGQDKGVEGEEQTNLTSNNTDNDPNNEARDPDFVAKEVSGEDDTVDDKPPVDQNGEGEEDLSGETIKDTSTPQVIDQGAQIFTPNSGAVAQIEPEDQAVLITDVKTALEVKLEDNDPVPAKTIEKIQVEAKPTEAAVADIGVTVSDDTDLTKLLNQLKESGTVQQKTLVNGLKKYMEDLQPGKPTAAAQGAMHQMRFWEILRGVVENPDPAEFRKQMFIVRAFFKRYAAEKTALNDHYIHRFAESWTRSPQQLAALQRLINIFQLTADPLTTTEKLKQVDLSRSLVHHFSEQHRQRVLSYFQQ